MSFPGRALEVDGQAWWAQELGLTRSGQREDPGVLLTLVGFRKATEPREAASALESYEKEAWLEHRRLEELSEYELHDLLASALPFKPVPSEAPSFFPGVSDGERRDRSGRGGRRRKRGRETGSDG